MHMLTLYKREIERKIDHPARNLGGIADRERRGAAGM